MASSASRYVALPPRSSTRNASNPMTPSGEVLGFAEAVVPHRHVRYGQRFGCMTSVRARPAARRSSQTPAGSSLAVSEPGAVDLEPLLSQSRPDERQSHDDVQP